MKNTPTIQNVISADITHQQTSINPQFFSEKFVSKLLVNFPASAHIKDAKTGKYVSSNKINSNLFGLEPSDIVGLSAWDLDQMMINRWDPNFIAEVVESEQRLIATGECVYNNKTFLTLNGKIRVQHMTKIPVDSTSNRIEKIFTISENLTPNLSLKELWCLYKQFYPHKKDIYIAIRQFLLHTGTLHMFDEFDLLTKNHDQTLISTLLPNEAELEVIIANVVHNQPGSAFISNVLNRPTRTVEDQIGRIKKKLAVSKEILFANMKIIEDNY